MVANKFQLAEAFTEFTIKGFTAFKSQMQQAKGLALAVAKPFLKLGSIISKAFSPLKLAIGGIGAGAAIFGLLKLASAAEEVRNRFGLVFSEMTEEVDEFVNKLGVQFKQSRTELRQSLAAYQGFFVGLKVGNKTASELSRTMLRLQVDFQSVADISTQEVQSKFLSALAGMPRVLIESGIHTREAAVNAELLAAGFTKAQAESSRLAKSLAVMKIIMDTMARQKTIGDLPRTMGSMANQARAMVNMFKELGETLGNFLTPIFKELAGLASAFAETFRRAAEGELPRVQEMLTSIGDIIRGIAKNVRNLEFGELQKGVTEIWESVIKGFGGAFLLIIETAADILLIAGKATGKAIVEEIRKLVPKNFPIIGKQQGIGTVGAPGFQAILDDAFGKGRGGAAGRGQPTAARQIAARLKLLTQQMKTLAELQARRAGGLFRDEFGNVLTKGAQAGVAEQEQAAKQSTALIDRLLKQLAGRAKKDAEKVIGQGAFAVFGFAALANQMQSIISKGEQAAIKLAEKRNKLANEALELDKQRNQLLEDKLGVVGP